MFGRMCPHCGKVFDKATNLVPNHAYPETPVGGRLCPGSEQNWRNPLSDRRPLWKDMDPADKVEAAADAASRIDEHMARMGSFEAASEAACVPNGFGQCSTHPPCEYTRQAKKELDYQSEVLSAGYRRMASALRLLREHLEYDGGATCDIGTMLKIIDKGEGR